MNAATALGGWWAGGAPAAAGIAIGAATLRHAAHLHEMRSWTLRRIGRAAARAAGAGI
ncbi:hypothetical protein [Streptomyces sp. NPDC001070]